MHTKETSEAAIAVIDAVLRGRLEALEFGIRRNKLAIPAREKGLRGFVARVRYNREKAKFPEPEPIDVAAIIYANVPELLSLRLTFAEPAYLVLEIQSVSGVWKKQYEYPVWSLAAHGVRSVAANLAFAIEKTRLAPVKAEIGYVEDMGEETPRSRTPDEIVAFIRRVEAHLRPLDEEAARRGIETPNAYGFQTTVDMKTASGVMCRVFFHTNNTNNKEIPYFVTIENRGPV